jgi:arylsulfatase A-like enzyme
LLENPKAAWDHPAFIHAGKYHGMVTDQYRYAYGDNQPEKLFDLQTDPDEWHNLATDPQHANRIRAMRAAVEEAWKGDVVTAPPAGTKSRTKKEGGKKAKGQQNDC